jgi:hypothetical protein
MEKYTNLNINLCNIIFHYSKELPFKIELLNSVEKYNFSPHQTKYANIYNGSKWRILVGSKKYHDYKLNRPYKSKRLYSRDLKWSIWKCYEYQYLKYNLI